MNAHKPHGQPGETIVMNVSENQIKYQPHLNGIIVEVSNEVSPSGIGEVKPKKQKNILRNGREIFTGSLHQITLQI
jgi:hypothetical protein